MSSKGSGKDGSQMRVKVHCRLRPGEESDFVKKSGENGDTVCLKGEENWKFDSFLGESISQEAVYNKVAEPIVSSVLKGYNGTVMAYGQTGSGKTHTMFGTRSDPGIIPRSLAHIFKDAETDQECEVTVSVSYVQIYCELLTDLLAPEDFEMQTRTSAIGRKPSTSLHIREDPKRGVFIENLKSVSVGSVEDAMAIVNEGDENRVRASTNMNASSSRSHACVIINVKKRQLNKKKVRYGKLILVDLAGSERVAKSLGENVFNGVRFTEARAINVSLSALGNCISALAKKNNHIPFRDAKLTRLLKDSLGGNSMTALVINISKDPTSYSETKSTLAFGSRAMAVTNTRVRVNEEVDYEQLYTNLQSSLDSREDQLAELEIALRKKEIELAEAKKATAKAESDKDMLSMQLKTVSVSGDVAEQIQSLEQQHRNALEQMERKYETQLQEEKSKANAAQEEWYRIEYELKAEREEHLRTCALLREKQDQLADLERSHEERLGELLEEIRALNEKNESLARNLKNAFDERKLLLDKSSKLESQLSNSKDFEHRGLNLMQRLTTRVEVLEKKTRSGKDISNNGDDDDEYDRYSSSGRTSNRSSGSKGSSRDSERRSLAAAGASLASNRRYVSSRKPGLPSAARPTPQRSGLASMKRANAKLSSTAASILQF